MKSIKRIIFTAVAICAVFAFASCSDKDDDDAAVTATYENAENKETVTFYDNGTFSVVAEGLGICMEGTYEGNAAVDGTIKVTPKKELSGPGQLDDIPSSHQKTTELKIADGKVTFEETEYTRK